jgi:hypothetical protein
MTATWEGVIGYVETRTKDGRCLAEPTGSVVRPGAGEPLRRQTGETSGDLLGYVEYVEIVGTEIRAGGRWSHAPVPNGPLHCGLDVTGDTRHTESGVARIEEWSLYAVTVHDAEDDAWDKPTTITVSSSGEHKRGIAEFLTARLDEAAAPCPICHEHGGFHDADDENGLHAAARARIPQELIHQTATEIRKKKRDARQLAYEAWKESRRST